MISGLLEIIEKLAEIGKERSPPVGLTSRMNLRSTLFLPVQGKSPH